MKSFLFASTAVALATLTPAFHTQAQDETATPSSPSKVMIVLDASGSMWGQVEGRTKIEIARETLKSTLSSLPAETEVGLIAYGHRRKGDCGDIELLQSARPGNATAISSSVEKLNPKGKTPLSDAVRMAAKELRSSEQKATVVLLTDGLETCKADPCALGKELKETGLDFTAHVIGLGLSREEGRKIACLAENTGGKYVSADSADDLKKAFDKTVKPSDDTTTDEPEDKGEATLKAPGEVTIGARFPVEWTGPDNEQDYISITKLGGGIGEGEASYAWTDAGSPLQIVAPGEPGDYEIHYVMQGKTERKILATLPIKVVPGDFSVEAPETTIEGAVVPVKWSAASVTDGSYIDLVPSGHTDTSGELSYAYVADGANLELIAPIDAGNYEIRFVLEAPDGRTVKFTRPLIVTRAEASVDFPSTVAAGSEITLSWSGPNNTSNYLDIVPEGYTETNGELAYAYISGGEKLTMVVPSTPGKYQVRFILEAGMGKRKVLYSAPLTVQ